MRLILWIILVFYAFWVGTLFSMGGEIKYIETVKAFNETAEYKLAKQLNGKYFGNCAEYKKFLQNIFPDMICRHYYAVKEFGHWECLIDEKNNIWTDANFNLRGTARLFRR